jgi:GTP 3',8-cyclase
MARDLLLKGIVNGSRAFIGPDIVQLDITNRCNCNCLCCWNNSPLLGEVPEYKKKEKESELPFKLIEKTIKELRKMGTKTLFFAGGGEPFMHPDILGILECAKNNKMRVCINTNFTLLDEEKVRRIVELRVDHIHVSLLAGNSESYIMVHPNKTDETFFRIKGLLKFLSEFKEKKQQSEPPRPHINMYYVIFNTNHNDIKEMVDLAIEVKANSLEFTPMDLIPEKTDSLLLNNKQIEQVLEEVKNQNKRLEELNDKSGRLIIFIEQYCSFIKRLSGGGADKGEYEAATIPSQPCYVGWSFARILANGNVNPCLKAHRITVGNIYEQSFKEIWNSQKQQLFRKKSFELNSADPYFKMIGNNPDSQFGCLNSCDNIQINIDMNNKYSGILKDYGRI